jgi:hypothetical protein
MSQETFNPRDPQYQKVEDLPEEHRPEFVDVPEEEGGGFVRKEAYQPILEAKIEAIVKNDPHALERKLDKLHEEALEMGKERGRLLAAVKQYGWALEFASEDFRHDLEFLLEVAKVNPKALAYAPEDIRRKLGIE